MQNSERTCTIAPRVQLRRELGYCEPTAITCPAARLAGGRPAAGAVNSRGYRNMTASWSPPGNATDLGALTNELAAWDVVMTTFFQEAVTRVQQSLTPGDTPQIVDAIHNGAGLQWSAAAINWNGFPKALLASNTTEAALRAAEKLAEFTVNGRKIKARPQDEYLEWHATTDAGGKIVAVDFTCEGPEYWQAIAQGYPDSVTPPAGAPAATGSLDAITKLYQQYVSPQVQSADLLYNGKYDPWNKWNTQAGAMHLTHPSNALQAEVFLAGDATVLREQNGVVLTDADALIKCAQYGVPERSSDPSIGAGVNALAREGALVSLQDPVGLYIDSLDTTGWTKPDGSPVGDYWTVLRGSGEFILRARYEVPAAEGFTVSDIQIGGEPIAYAGQIAQNITMRLTGVAAEAGKYHDTPVGCVQAAAGAAAQAPAVAVYTTRRMAIPVG
jgi:hypothetical protein